MQFNNSIEIKIIIEQIIFNSVQNTNNSFCLQFQPILGFIVLCDHISFIVNIYQFFDGFIKT